MTKLDKVLYTAKVHTTGGRDGAAQSDDGRLDITLSPPSHAGTGTNPEQLFAAGWSACFIGAMGIAADKMKVTLPAELAVDAEVDLCLTGGSCLPAAGPRTGRDRVPAIRCSRSPRQTRCSVRLCPKL